MLAYRVRFAVGWLVLLCAQLAVIHAAPASSHGYGTKSFAQAYLECLNYLNVSRQSLYAYDSTAVPLNSGGNCLLRCIGLNTRWWHDETGLNERALLRFFRRADEDSLEQARSCMVKMPTCDTCAAAYQSFRCYSDVLGELITHPEYVAPCRQEIRRAVNDCAQMLQVPDGELTSCVASETFLRDGNASALLRCVVLRLGLYADSIGVLCDRVQLLMDADTAERWTVERAEEAKKCEQDLRALGSEPCVVAAHAVEICYGWTVFGELWQALKEEYSSSNEIEFVNEYAEALPATSSTTEELQRMRENAVPAAEEDVEVFMQQPRPRFRGLMIVAPELFTVDAIIENDSSKTSQSSSEEEENNLPKDGEVEQTEFSEVTEAESTTENNAEKTSSMPQKSTEEKTKDAHTILKRSLGYQMVNDQFSYENSAPLSYLSRMRRSALPYYHHYIPEVVPVMHPNCLYPTVHPIVKRCIPLYSMCVPAYNQIESARFVRAVDPSVVDMVIVDSPISAAEASFVAEPYPDVAQMEHEEIVPMLPLDTDENVEDPKVYEILPDNSQVEVPGVPTIEGENMPQRDSFQPESEDTDQSATSQDFGTLATDDSKFSKNSSPEDSEPVVPTETSSLSVDGEKKNQNTPLENVSEAVQEKEVYSDMSDTVQYPVKSVTSNDDLAQAKTNFSQTEVDEKLVPTNGDSAAAPETTNETSTPFRGSTTVATEATIKNTEENDPSVSKKAIHPNTLQRLVRALRDTNFIDTILSAIKGK